MCCTHSHNTTATHAPWHGGLQALSVAALEDGPRAQRVHPLPLLLLVLVLAPDQPRCDGGRRRRRLYWRRRRRLGWVHAWVGLNGRARPCASMWVWGWIGRYVGSVGRSGCAHMVFQGGVGCLNHRSHHVRHSPLGCPLIGRRRHRPQKEGGHKKCCQKGGGGANHPFTRRGGGCFLDPVQSRPGQGPCRKPANAAPLPLRRERAVAEQPRGAQQAKAAESKICTCDRSGGLGKQVSVWVLAVCCQIRVKKTTRGRAEKVGERSAMWRAEEKQQQLPSNDAHTDVAAGR